MKTLEEILEANHFHSLSILHEVYTPDGNSGSERERLEKAIKEYVEQFLDEAAEEVVVSNDDPYGSQEEIKETILKLKEQIK